MRALITAVAAALITVAAPLTPAAAAPSDPVTVTGVKAPMAWESQYSALKSTVLDYITAFPISPYQITTNSTNMYFGPKGATRVTVKQGPKAVTTICKPPTVDGTVCYKKVGKNGAWKKAEPIVDSTYVYKLLDSFGRDPATALTAAKKTAEVTTVVTGKKTDKSTTMTAVGKFFPSEFSTEAESFNYVLVAKTDSLAYTASNAVDGTIVVAVTSPETITFPKASTVR